MSDFTPEQKLDYYKSRLTFWQTKLERLLDAGKKKHAKRRIAHYEGKIASFKA